MSKFLERFRFNNVKNINLGSLSNLRNLGKSGLGDFHNRQKILLVALIVLGVCMLFYWTNAILAEKRASTIAAAENTKDRIVRVHTLMHRIDDKRINARTLDTGLLSFVQGMGNRTEIRGKLVNIRLVSSANRQEQVTFRTENLVLKEFADVLKDIEQYDNVWIRSLVITKRFDNPMRLDVSWDIIRGE
jgi:hypothetical protein